jgi:predicted ATPase
VTGGLYFVTPDRNVQLAERLRALAEGQVPAPATLPVMMGRLLTVPAAAGKVCMFGFRELCGRALGAADYIALAEAYHTLALSDVPVFTAANRAEAYRFVTLVDVMYEHRVRLICSADALPFELFQNIVTQEQGKQLAGACGMRDESQLEVDDNLGFSKDRTISRLTEMQSIEHLLVHAQQHAPQLVLALEEAQAKANH